MSAKAKLCAYATLVALLVSSRPALAAGTNLSIDRFDPSLAGDRLFGVDSAEINGDFNLDVRLTLDYAHNPLVFHSTTNNATVEAIVANQLVGNLGGTLSLWNRLAISLDIPVLLLQDGPNPSFAGYQQPSPSGIHIGDIRVGARGRIVTGFDGLLTLSLGGFLWLPLGSSSSTSGMFASDGDVRGRVEALLGGERGRFIWDGSVGVDIRRSQTYLSVPEGSMILVKAGAGWLFLSDKQLQVAPEINLGLTPSKVERYNTNLELLLGARYQFANRLEAGLAAGSGLTSGIGTPDFRIVATLGYGAGFRKKAQDRDGDGVIDQDDACPDMPGVRSAERAKNGCPPDRDGDGIIDHDDACPDVPGVRSTEPGKNGCPPDRDGDGIIDSEDACPDVPGPASQEASKNGCPLPPPDRDGDGIADADDACPDVKGVASADPTKNGCPPPPSDRDGDGIVDSEDACPDVKGGPSPDPKQNGCPTGAVVGNQIVVLNPIQFATGSDRILPESEVVLKAVLTSIRGLSGDRFLIEGHTDNRGKSAKNRALSLARAKSVIRWMVAHGIAANRFESKGYGPDQPLTTNSTEKGRKANRRVEIHIIK